MAYPKAERLKNPNVILSESIVLLPPGKRRAGNGCLVRTPHSDLLRAENAAILSSWKRRDATWPGFRRQMSHAVTRLATISSVPASWMPYSAKAVGSPPSTSRK